MKLLLLLLCVPNYILGLDECNAHYCDCPPFLANDPSLKKSVFFNKYPYPEHYAILGRAKELHCCFGGNFTSVTWFKDGVAYPWTKLGSTLPILFAKNQSLVIVSMTHKDEGQYKCVAKDGDDQMIDHQTMLRSYSMPNYHHLPLWSEEPMDQLVTEGAKVELNCSAVVGPQYNSIKLKPVRATWKNSQGRPLEAEFTETLQDVSDDEMIYGAKLRLNSVKKSQAGKYTCIISNHYGVLTKTVNVELISSGKLEKSKGSTLKSLLMSQIGLFERLLNLADGRREEAIEEMRKIKEEML